MENNTNMKTLPDFLGSLHSRFLTQDNHILIVGDQFAITATLTVMLKHFGFKVSIETNPSAILQLLETMPNYFDLVIADQNMKNMTDSQLIRTMIAIRPDIPILLATDDHKAILCSQIKVIETLEFIRKPPDFNGLLERIGSLGRVCCDRVEHILVLDHQFPITRTLTQVLKHFGLKVTVNTGGPEILDLLHFDPTRFDVVISDQNKKHMSRSQLIREIIVFRPDIPTILTTEDHRAIFCSKIKSVEAMEFICQPTDLNELLHKIAELLNWPCC